MFPVPAGRNLDSGLKAAVNICGDGYHRGIIITDDYLTTGGKTGSRHQNLTADAAGGFIKAGSGDDGKGGFSRVFVVVFYPDIEITGRHGRNVEGSHGKVTVAIRLGESYLVIIEVDGNVGTVAEAVTGYGQYLIDSPGSPP